MKNLNQSVFQTVLIVGVAFMFACKVEAAAEPELTGGLSRIQSKAEVMQNYASKQKVIARKLRQAELLLRVSRYQDCVKLCEEILAQDNSVHKAKTIRRIAKRHIEKKIDKKLNKESREREKAVLHEVTKFGMPPERKEDLPRPDRYNLPFQDEEEDVAKMNRILDAVIPEINVVDTDVSYLLQLLYKTNDINIIYPPEAVADKKITIQARNIRFGDILQYLSRNQGLHYTVAKGVVWLYAESQDGENNGSLFRPAVIQLNTGLTIAAGTNNFSSNDSGSEDGSSSSGGSTGEGSLTDVEAMLEWMQDSWPGWPEKTTWIVDYKTNKVIICSTPTIIEDVRKVISMIDVPPVQVLITAVFVTIGEKDFDQLGFTWSVIGNDQNTNSQSSHNKVTAQKSNLFGSGLTAFSDDPGRIISTGAVGVLSQHEFKMTMDAVNSKTSTKVTTAPRIIALNNHPSIIDISSKFPYPTNWETVTSGVSTDTNTATSTTVVPSAWVEQDVGFKLKVLPSVGGDMKTIYLQIVPEITAHNATDDVQHDIVVTNSTGTSQVIQVTRPVFSTKKIEAEASVDDGQTVVIGGLIQDNVNDTNTAVPILGKIPVLGNLFKSTNNRRDRSFELIFITANIITPDNRHYASPANTEVGDDTLNRWLGDPQGGR